MHLSLDPTYVVFDGVVLGHRSSTTLICPICGESSLEIVGVYREQDPDTPLDVRSIGMVCSQGHNFAWKFRSSPLELILLSVDVVVIPAQVALNLADKWHYDPSKRFVNHGGYSPASEAQVNKIRTLGGVHPNAFHELYTLITRYWNYKGFEGWSSNDAGFVIAWLTGKYGEFPAMEVPKETE